MTLKLILKEQPDDPHTPAQVNQRERFARAAKEAKEELKGKKLKGAAKVRAFNQLISEKLHSEQEKLCYPTRR